MPRPPRSRRTALVAATLAAALVLGCSQDPSAEEERRRLADDLVAETGGDLGAAEADCVAGRLQEEFGDRSYDDLLDAARRRNDEDDPVRAQVIDIFAGCGALEAVATTEG